MKTISLNPTFNDLLRDNAQGLEVNEILKKNLASFLSVEDEEEKALKKIGIDNIFDLGASWVFGNARLLTSFGQAGSAFNRLGFIPNDYLAAGAPETAADKLSSLNIEFLKGLNGFANDIKTALSVNTIREFANWPPYEIARQLVSVSLGTNINTVEDEAEELRPRFGEYPTQRVYYDSLVMLKMLDIQQANVVNINARKDLRIEGGTISLKEAIDKKGRFSQPAIGALFTFSQSWYSQGVTLGQMLHSLGLAPGEVTRLAIIDWNRRTSGKETESIAETEKLDSASTHALALTEVQNAVADEIQSGGSKSSSSTDSSSKSVAESAGTGLLTSLTVSADESATYQDASTQSQAESSSWSQGHRGVSADMSKNINDRTEQHSSSARSRRAAIVKEVSQSEHEQVSTRVVANYNHMHALTIQYYEVVQVYRTVSQLHKFERCFFLPMEILDFNDDNVIDRYRFALMRGAINRTIRDILFDDTSSVILLPQIRQLTFINPLVTTPAAEVADAKPGAKIMKKTSALFAASAAAPVAMSSTAFSVSKQAIWSNEVLTGISRIVNRTLLRPNSDGLHLSDNTQIIRISFSSELKVKQINLHNITTGDTLISVGTDQYSVSLDTPKLLSELDKIQLQKTDSSTALDGNMILTCSVNGAVFEVPVPVSAGNVTGLVDIIKISTDREDRLRKLKTHLAANAEYYSRIVYRNLDSATITLLLADYQWNGKPLLDMVEPRPYQVTGNYLILKAPVGRDTDNVADPNLVEWNKIIDENAIQIGETDERLVPLPTGGVFAEAVLGRSNASEKLDITRFWNWQDSPIPILPTEISPVGTGSRGTTEDLKPGQLSSPVLNIVNPTNLPSGSELGGILSAISNGNMFRDMSGLAGTQGLVKTGIEQTLQAATDAGQLASTNMRTEAQKAVAMGQIAADLAKSAISAATGVPASGGGGSVQGISGDGARINHGKSMDDRGITPGSSGSTGTSGNGAGGGTTAPQSNGGGTGGGGGTTSLLTGAGSSPVPSGGGSNEQSAFDRSTWGAAGASAGDLADGMFKFASAGGVANPTPQIAADDFEGLFSFAKTHKQTSSTGINLRKSHRSLTDGEWDAFKGAINALQSNGKYQAFIDVHDQAVNTAMMMPNSVDDWQAHSMGMSRGLNFLSWHRAFLCAFEDKLQEIDPNITIPYWDWFSDSNIPVAMTSGIVFNRNVGPKNINGVTVTMPTPQQIKDFWKRAVSSLTDFLTMQRDLEHNLHDLIHVFVGGDMAAGMSPKDPLFFMHHCFIDKLWSDVQSITSGIKQPSNLDSDLLPSSVLKRPTGAAFKVRDIINIQTIPDCAHNYEELFVMPLSGGGSPATSPGTAMA